eukprot:3110717-Pyramimonas_sp.AAC.1
MRTGDFHWTGNTSTSSASKTVRQTSDAHPLAFRRTPSPSRSAGQHSAEHQYVFRTNSVSLVDLIRTSPPGGRNPVTQQSFAFSHRSPS